MTTRGSTSATSLQERIFELFSFNSWLYKGILYPSNSDYSIIYFIQGHSFILTFAYLYYYFISKEYQEVSIIKVYIIFSLFKIKLCPFPSWFINKFDLNEDKTDHFTSRTSVLVFLSKDECNSNSWSSREFSSLYLLRPEMLVTIHSIRFTIPKEVLLGRKMKCGTKIPKCIGHWWY